MRVSENLRQGVCLFATCSAGHVTTFRGKLYNLTFADPGPLHPVLSEVEHFSSLKAIMAFKTPQICCKSLTEGYFEGFPKFNWSDLQDKEEIGKGSFGSVCKARFVSDSRMVVVKRFFGAGDVILKNVAKEAKMLQRARHPKIAEFLGVCSKPVAIIMVILALFITGSYSKKKRIKTASDVPYCRRRGNISCFLSRCGLMPLRS